VVGTLEVLPLFAHKAKARGLALGTVGGLLAKR